MVTEIQVMVRLAGEDAEHFEEVKKKTKVQINAEVMRVAFRWYYECMIQGTTESIPPQQPGSAIPGAPKSPRVS